MGETRYLYQAAAWILVNRGDSGVAAAERLLDSARLIEPGAYMDLLRHAWLRYAAGDYRGTIAFAQRAYLLRRDSVDAIMVLTQAAQRINDVRDADAAYRLALSDHPSDESLRRSYVTMLTAIGDTAGARAVRRHKIDLRRSAFENTPRAPARRTASGRQGLLASRPTPNVYGGTWNAQRRTSNV